MVENKREELGKNRFTSEVNLNNCCAFYRHTNERTTNATVLEPLDETEATDSGWRNCRKRTIDAIDEIDKCNRKVLRASQTSPIRNEREQKHHELRRDMVLQIFFFITIIMYLIGESDADHRKKHKHKAVKTKRIAQISIESVKECHRCNKY